MVKTNYFLALVVVFLLGWAANSAYSLVYFESNGSETPYMTSILSNERDSPSNLISEKDIEVLNDKIIIHVKNATWSKYADTNSMDPVFDIGANGLQIKPQTTTEINVGDIISYTSSWTNGDTIVHRVSYIGNDKEGWYAYAKGDNNDFRDPGKIRFKEIKSILIGIIY
ncbi:hypothetical protein J4468_00005 [Candidatus Woesearchaeota archaeon]|nr:hypothetical protein [Candidatus Woesearchaeota archaeon]